MANKEGSKIRALVIVQLLRQRGRTTTKEIKDVLSKRFDMDVDRRTIYSDMEQINWVYPVRFNRGTMCWELEKVGEDVD